MIGVSRGATSKGEGSTNVREGSGNELILEGVTSKDPDRDFWDILSDEGEKSWG